MRVFEGQLVPDTALAMKPVGFDFFSHDFLTGITTWRRFKFNAKDPDLSSSDFVRTQDVSEVLDDNKRGQYNARGTFTQRGRMGVHAATIPAVVQQKWLVEEGIDVNIASECPWTQRKVRAKLNSTEYAHLRVAEFTL